MIIYYNSTNYCVTCMQHIFIIDPCTEASIYKAWRTRAGKWLRDMFHDIYENDVSTHWLTDEILQALRAHLDSLEFQAKQVKAWRAEDQLEVARCTLEAPLPLMARDWGW